MSTAILWETVGGAAGALGINQFTRSLCNAQSIDRNDVIAALGGAILGTVIKCGVNFWTGVPMNYPPKIRTQIADLEMMQPHHYLITLTAALAMTGLTALNRVW